MSEVKHRNTEGLSYLGKEVIRACPNAYVENGQVFDPCHVWFSEPQNPTDWNVKLERGQYRDDIVTTIKENSDE